MKIPGLDTVLDDVKDMQGDLNTRLDLIAEKLDTLIEIMRNK